MATLVKTINGLIYTNDFSESILDPLLIVSPSDAYNSLSERIGYLSICGSDNINPVMVLLDPKCIEYTMIIKVDYIPASDNNAGIVLYKDADNYAFLSSFFSDTIDVGIIYTVLKIMRKDKVVEFYGETIDHSWKFLGNLNVRDMYLYIGAYVMGTQKFYIDKLDIYNNNNITITNLVNDCIVKIFDSEDNELYSAIVVDEIVTIGINSPVTGKIVVYDSDMLLLVDSGIIYICNGDEYSYNIDVEIYIQDTVSLQWETINPLGAINLGYFENPTIDRRLAIRNIDTDIINNLDISIKPYSIFKKGYQNAELAIDPELGEDMEYSQLITKLNLEPNGVFEFNMKINRDENAIAGADYAFNIRVKAW